MTDIINAFFEMGAAIFLSFDYQALRRDRRVAGISVVSRIFFVLWGLFNPYFYAAQGLMWSFMAGLVVCGVNFVWLFQYYKIRAEEQVKQLNVMKQAEAYAVVRDRLVAEGVVLKGLRKPTIYDN
jgi:Na+-driven multidrug efflux pump